jgi:serine protease Do
VTVTSQGGVLGLSGEDWEQGGVRGVEITEVADNSSAQLAGLRKGHVITDVNGAHVRSTQELGSILAQMDPGTRVSIGYLYKSNLGWMPQETVAILGK